MSEHRKYSVTVTTSVHAAVNERTEWQGDDTASQLFPQEAGGLVTARTSRIRPNQCPLPPTSDSQVMPESPFVVLRAPLLLAQVQCQVKQMRRRGKGTSVTSGKPFVKAAETIALFSCCPG